MKMIYPLISLLSITNSLEKASINDHDFKIFACGVLGGVYTQDLTSFFLSEPNDEYNYISLDAGASYDCLKTALDNNQIDYIIDPDGYASESYDKIGYFRKKQLNGFMISHGHLDHNNGLIISSADELFGTTKPVISRPKVIRDFLYESFHEPRWPVYTIFGYHNVTIDPDDTTFTSLEPYGYGELNIKTFRLVHTVNSTAFLICNKNITSCILFFGDTGADSIEHSNDIQIVWEFVADFIKNGTLNTMFLECSYVDSRPDNLLFGHLRPNLMLEELYKLSLLTGTDLEGLSVIVMHVKPDLTKTGDIYTTLGDELNNPTNTTFANLNVNFIFPQQTDMIYIRNGKLTGVQSASSTTGSNESNVAIKTPYAILIGFAACLVAVIIIIIVLKCCGFKITK